MYSFVLPFLLTNIAALNVMLYEKYTLLIAGVCCMERLLIKSLKICLMYLN